MRKFLIIYAFIVVAVIALMGFRGEKFEKPPLEIFPDMDWTPRYEPQGQTDFFVDGRMDRPTPPGTVAMVPAHLQVFTDDPDALSLDEFLTAGQTEDGSWARGYPYEVNRSFLELGREKYEIFCTVCHGATGAGNGAAWVVAQQNNAYNMIVTSLLDQRLIDMPEGEIYNTIKNGKNLMGAYGYKLRVKERWAIVAYVRALQTAQQVRADDLPPSARQELGL